MLCTTNSPAALIERNLLALPRRSALLLYRQLALPIATKQHLSSKVFLAVLLQPYQQCDAFLQMGMKFVFEIRLRQANRNAGPTLSISF